MGQTHNISTPGALDHRLRGGVRRRRHLWAGAQTHPEEDQNKLIRGRSLAGIMIFSTKLIRQREQLAFLKKW
jgi:hypothetical protein